MVVIFLILSSDARIWKDCDYTKKVMIINSRQVKVTGGTLVFILWREDESVFVKF